MALTLKSLGSFWKLPSHFQEIKKLYMCVCVCVLVTKEARRGHLISRSSAQAVASSYKDEGSGCVNSVICFWLHGKGASMRSLASSLEQSSPCSCHPHLQGSLGLELCLDQYLSWFSSQRQRLFVGLLKDQISASLSLCFCFLFFFLSPCVSSCLLHIGLLPVCRCSLQTTRERFSQYEPLANSGVG